MKQVSKKFKESIINQGRQQQVILTFDNIIWDSNDLYSIEMDYEGNLTKSMMKCLTIESIEPLKEGQILNYQYGILIDSINDIYEYINFGNFIVKDIEKNEDKNTYKITCYDYMLKSMIQYENMNIEYPISIREYIKKICNFVGLEFADANNVFANYDKMISSELFSNQSITYRDVFDYLSQVVGASICINENNKVCIKTINETYEIIDANYLKDNNITFQKKYGKINSIVLSRAGESDNVYIQDEKSIEENGLCEYKIVENQIMNFNDRSVYLPDLLKQLGGIEFYLNDIQSTGIMYLDYMDAYNIKIDNQIYRCIMLNNSHKIKSGLEEYIYTDEPEESVTEYEKADKIDNRISQTYLIVDKQNRQIEGMIDSINDIDKKQAKLTLTVDELNSKISDISDITISAESLLAKVELTNVNKSEPIMIKLHPTSVVADIVALYPYTKDIGIMPSKDIYPNNNLFPLIRTNINAHLYPSNTIYPKDRLIRFINSKENKIVTYRIPMDLLFVDNDTYDEFILSYDNQICQVIKRVGADYKNENKYKLDEEIIYNFEYPKIMLDDGDYIIDISNQEFGYLFVRLMTQNAYTTQFAMKVDVESQIRQTEQEIDLSVNKKLELYPTTTEMNAQFSVTAEEIKSRVQKDKIISEINQSAEGIKINAEKISLEGKELDLTTENMTITSNTFNIESDGKVNIKGRYASKGSYIPLTVYTDTHNAETHIYSNRVEIEDKNIIASMNILDTPKSSSLVYTGLIGLTTNSGYARIITDSDDIPYISVANTNNYEEQTNISHNSISCHGTITADVYNYYSLESFKKDIEKLEINAIDLVKNAELYTFRYKTEDDNVKKHIGFVIGNNYKTPKEIISNNENGIDSYNMISLLWKAVQEQQKQIEDLKKLNKLKGDD